MMHDDPAKTWGLPDWRDASSYGDVESWRRNRWRWEFLRRREDLRVEFLEKAPKAYKDSLSRLERMPTAFPDGRVLTPDEAGFFVGTWKIHQSHEKLPNPKISDQPYYAISWSDWPEVWTRYYKVEPPEDKVRFDFDISKPIEPQLKMARAIMQEEQVERYGKPVQRRSRPEKFLTYLRVLDARECGASWSETAKILIATAGTEQTARDTWEQARALCFNF